MAEVTKPNPAEATANKGLAREHDLHRRRQSRNIGVLVALGGFIVLLFAVSIVKLGNQSGNPSADGGAWTTTIYEALVQ